jgi:hypothetical protein
MVQPLAVAPKWLAKDARLSEDEDLRRLQLKWFSDDIWLRRGAFLLLTIIVLLAAFLLLVRPPSYGPGLGFLGLLSTPLAYFLGIRRKFHKKKSKLGIG